ncbi:MAG: ABC transporter substrate-binding protein [Gammaproteobacteria bacterium]|nr:ABC transporter substrate-binding protein [Gammaproteobacteria bacterium]
MFAGLSERADAQTQHGAAGQATTASAGAIDGGNDKASDSAAEAVVESLHAALVEAMKSGASVAFEQRSEQLQPVIENSFDFPYIAKLVLAGHWKSLEPAQLDRMSDTMRDLTVASYASNFNRYDDERFESRGVQTTGRGRKVVRSALVEASGNTVSFDYLMHQTDAGLRIINVIAEGVSDLALKRSQYAAVIESEGFDQLLAKIHKQIADMANDG